MDYAKLQHQTSVNTIIVPEQNAPNNSTKGHLIKEDFTGPVEKRRRTNTEFLILFGIFVLVWFFLALYCIANGDLSRLHIESDQKLETNLKDTIKIIKIASGEIYLSCTFAVALSAVLIVLFRHYAGVIVWLVVGIVIAFWVILSMTFWVLWQQEKAQIPDHSSDGVSTSWFISAISTTIFTIVLSLIVYALRKNIKMVVVLFKEGGKVAQTMPLIMAQPFVTLLSVIATLALAIYFFLWIESAGYPTKDESGEITYVKDEVMQFARGYNIVAWLWVTQFFLGCQDMIIAGATATWFFTRDKTRVTKAISKSYNYLFKYHLGSVALGSLLITMIKIIRYLYNLSKNNSRNPIAVLMRCFFRYLERIVSFLTRNAYIEIAIYGDGFWVSGKRAFYALTNNVVNVATLNKVGDFVMVMGRVTIVALSVGFGYLLLQGKQGINDLTGPLMLIGIFAFIVSDAFMVAFEMIVDSIFICFCEDCELHDGLTQPYYMNKELMVFINKENDKVLRVGDAAN